MTQSTYNKANKLQEEIAKLKYEIEVLKQNYEKPTKIRFGTEYNVSIPIEFDREVYIQAIADQLHSHHLKLKQTIEQFNDL